MRTGHGTEQACAVAAGFLAALSVTACGGAETVTTPAPAAPAPPPVVAEPDAFRDFRGLHVAAGKPFRLAIKPVAVDGADIVVTLVKVDWSTMTGPSGKETKEATANLRIAKGEETRTLTISQGESSSMFGARITLRSAGDDYDKARMSYDPWIEVQVDAAAVDKTP